MAGRRPIRGTGRRGEGAVGIWATSTDPTLVPFTGKVHAVSDTAAAWSVAPRNKEIPYDPTYLPVMRCVPLRTG